MRQVSSLAVDACDGGGYREFELIEPSDGQVVAAAWRYVECHQAQRAARVKTAKHEELLGTIGLFEDAAERAHDNHGTQEQDDDGSLEGNAEQVSQGGSDLGKKVTNVESEFFGAHAELRR